MRVSVRLAAGANSAAGCLAIAIAHTHTSLAACVFSSPKCAHGCVCVFGDEIATPYIATFSFILTRVAPHTCACISI